MTPEWKLFINFCPNSVFHPRFTCRGRIWRKSAVAKLPKSHLVLPTKKRCVRDTFWPTFRPHLAYRAQNSAYNNNISDERVVQHLDCVQRTWLDSTVWPPSVWSAFKQPVRTNNDVEGWHARLNSRANHGRLNLYQLLYLLHEEAVLVNIGVHMLSDAGTSRLQRKKYTRLHSRLSTMWDRVRCWPSPPHCLLACREAHVNSYL